MTNMPQTSHHGNVLLQQQQQQASNQQVMDVLSSCITASTMDTSSIMTPLTNSSSTAGTGNPADHIGTNTATIMENSDDDGNRRHVIEYEWLGAQFSGIYTGQLSVISNNPDGDGTLRVDDGAVYNGEWMNGQPHGMGVWVTIEGDVYCSQSWNHGTKHGKTVDVLCDGCVYRGMYEHGQRHGYGILTWPYGAHYVGQFVHDKRHGEGIYTYPDKRCYTGAYHDDRPHGYGKMTSADGTVLYDGMWQLGEFIGNSNNNSSSSSSNNKTGGTTTAVTTSGDSSGK
jgi:hypothetical protein